MKKLAKWLGLAVVMACLGVSLMACGGSKKLEGKYSMSMEMRGQKVKYVITLEKDGKATLSLSAGGKSEVMEEGSYKVDGNKIAFFDEDGDPFDLDNDGVGTIVKGKKITVSIDGDTYVFKR